ncbi:MAG: hypothetical protein AAF950_02480 [Pseudomonadota bacterium]
MFGSRSTYTGNKRVVRVRPLKVLALAFGGLAIAPAASAYVGPGAGLTAIGSLLALIGTIVLMIVGFVWYPVKRLLRRRKATTTADTSATGETQSNDTPPE